jgi:hypothetical protein
VVSLGFQCPYIPGRKSNLLKCKPLLNEPNLNITLKELLPKFIPRTMSSILSKKLTE